MQALEQEIEWGMENDGGRILEFNTSRILEMVEYERLSQEEFN